MCNLNVMEKVNFNFVDYHSATENYLCVKPIYDGNPNETIIESELGYYPHCTTPNEEHSEKLKSEFYSGKRTILYYDVKLCHSTVGIQYNIFLKEFLRRSKNQTCAIHISNSTIPDRNNALTSIYDLPYLKPFLTKVLQAESDIIVEVSDKRIMEMSAKEEYKRGTIAGMLHQSKNVKHYMLREEIYKRDIVLNPKVLRGIEIYFDDDYTKLRKEVIRYSDKINNQRD